MREKERKRVKGASATNGTVCTKCIPRAGEGGRASRSFPQEYPTNSIEVACAPSTNQVSLYLNACGNKRHVRIGTRTRARQVSLFTFLPTAVAPFLRFPSPFSHPSRHPEANLHGASGNVSSSNYEHVLIIASDAFFSKEREREREII